MTTAYAAIALASLASRANACPVCFGGGENARLPTAYLIGAAILIGATFCMLGGLAYAVYQIEAARKEVDFPLPRGSSGESEGLGT